MGNLNWRAHSPEPSVGPHPKLQNVITLSMDKAELGHLVSALEEAFAAGEELRLNLPREWIIFWKTRPENDESRLLLAHPNLDEWVATAALTQSHAKKLLESLRAIGTGTEKTSSVSVSTLHKVGGFSNTEIVLALKQAT